MPLVNGMLSGIPIDRECPCTHLLNFPCTDGWYFEAAYLASCPDEAVCELNIAPLIQSGYEEDFQDLDDIQRHETEPHIFSRLKLEYCS